MSPIQAVEDEARKWPGVTVRAVPGRRRHIKLILERGDQSRIFVVSKSTSDHRAWLNARSDLRRLLTELGATKEGV